MHKTQTSTEMSVSEALCEGLRVCLQRLCKLTAGLTAGTKAKAFMALIDSY